MSDFLWPYGLQHTRSPWPSPTPEACSNSRLLSRWCHPTISSSVVPFSSCLQPFPASGSFPMSQFFVSGGQSIGASTSASVLPKNIKDWSPLGWTGWISLQSKGLSRVLSNTTVQKHQSFGARLSLRSSSHVHTRPLEKVHRMSTTWQVLASWVRNKCFWVCVILQTDQFTNGVVERTWSLEYSDYTTLAFQFNSESLKASMLKQFLFFLFSRSTHKVKI